MPRSLPAYLTLIVAGLCLAGAGSAEEECATATATATDMATATATATGSGDVPEAEDILRDTVFNEIQLTPEGVTAVDTAGFAWYYDFDNEVFVTGQPELGEERFPVERRAEDGLANDVSIEERCTEERRVKHFERGNITVGYDEYVDGDIRTWGRVYVKGWVKGDVISPNRRVVVSETGRVDGNIHSPEVVVKAGGEVGGEIVEDVSPLEFTGIEAPFSASFLIVIVSITIFISLMTLLAVLVAPKQFGNFHACLARYRAKTFLLGLLFVGLFPVISVLVAITIVGIPLVPLVPLAYVGAIVLGTASVGSLIVGRIASRSDAHERMPLSHALGGVLVFMVPWLITAAVWGADGVAANVLGGLMLAASITFSTIPLAMGLGAAVLTRFGFREYAGIRDRLRASEDRATPVPAPPPIPDDPTPGRPPGA